MIIYYLEDDLSIAYIIQKTLEKAGFEFEGFDKGESFIRAFRQKTPDMVLIDMMLPDISGLEVLKKIRVQDSHIPIMVISALSSEMDKVQALDLGADDYITKPFGILELTSRIQAHLRKVPPKDMFEVGNIRLDLSTHNVFVADEKVHLTNKEFDILFVLMKNQSQVVSKDTLFKEVWHTDVIVETRTLDMHIKSLRQKLQHANIDIKTVRGVGYHI